MIEYITYNDLTRDIRNNYYKIPKDVFGVIGIPRSGMLPATIIAEYLNVGLSTIDEFCSSVDVHGSGIKFQHGNRKLKENNSKKILVVDDTCYNGNEILKNMKNILSLFLLSFIWKETVQSQNLICI